MLPHKLKRKLHAFSMIELVVALGIITLIVSAGFAAFTFIESRTGKVQKIINDLEKPIAVFNIFYDFYNSSDLNTKSIEQLNTSNRVTNENISIRFDSGTNSNIADVNTSSIPKTITFHNLGSSLDGILSYRVFDNASDNCKFSSGSNFNYSISCKDAGLANSLNRDFNALFNLNSPKIKEIYIGMLDGKLCKIIGFNNSQWVLSPNNSGCPSSLINNPTSSGTSYFTPPRMILFNQDGSYTRTVLESLVSPVNKYNDDSALRTPASF